MKKSYEIISLTDDQVEIRVKEGTIRIIIHRPKGKKSFLVLVHP